MSRYSKPNFSIVCLLAVILGIAISALPAKKDADFSRSLVSLSITPDKPLNLSQHGPDPLDAPVTAKPGSAKIVPAETIRWHIETVTAGDSLSDIFKRAGLSPAELQSIMSIGKYVNTLVKIQPGQRLHFLVTESGTLEALKYVETPLRTLNIIRDGGAYSASWTQQKPRIVTSVKSASITEAFSSLYLAGKHANLSDNLIMKLANIFKWDISFALDIRVGDRFTLLYQDIYIDGKKVKEGDILAAQFTNMARTYTAILFADKDGARHYFTPQGRSLRKKFLRDPVHFSKVSSRFNLRRLHPIRRVVRPHRGIDYAAKRGTPVVASGDGKVKIARQNGASGKYVVIQHGRQYTTKYLHLSAFARGLRSGSRVKQGQTIGYVGATGLANGPHLHYEFLVNGLHRNPRTVTLPRASSILGGRYDAFKDTADSRLLQLNGARGETRYAALASDD